MNSYWEERHRKYRGSWKAVGPGSRGRIVGHKVQMVNALLQEVGAESLLDLGVGDGRVARGFRVQRFTGLDISETAVEQATRCLAGRHGWTVGLVGPTPPACDVAVSLDVVFHCIEDVDYRAHLDALFGSARLAVGIYSTDHDALGKSHVRHRQVSREVAAWYPDWRGAIRMLPPWPQAKYKRAWSNSLWMVWRPACR